MKYPVITALTQEGGSINITRNAEEGIIVLTIGDSDDHTERAAFLDEDEARALFRLAACL